jgi:hypothetical protein
MPALPPADPVRKGVDDPASPACRASLGLFPGTPFAAPEAASRIGAE